MEPSVDDAMIRMSLEELTHMWRNGIYLSRQNEFQMDAFVYVLNKYRS